MPSIPGMPGITTSITKQIKEAVDADCYKIDHENKAIVISLGGKITEALVIDGDGLKNVYIKDKNNQAGINHLYHAYNNKSQPKTAIEARDVKHDGDSKSKDSAPSGSRAEGLERFLSKDNKRSPDKKAGKFDPDELKNIVQKTAMLKNKISELAKILKDIRGIDWDGDNEARRVMDKCVHSPIEELEEISNRGEALFYRHDAPSGNPAGAKPKIKTYSKEANAKLIDLIDRTNELEKRLCTFVESYKYPTPDPVSASFKDREKYWNQRYNIISSKLSSHCVDFARKGNANIEDLGDMNRPNNISTLFSGAYEESWTDLFLDIKRNMHDEKEIIKMLLESLMTTHKICEENMALNIDKKKNLLIKELNKQFTGVDFNSEHMEVFLTECCKICTGMLAQIPPMVFGKPVSKGDDFPDAFYKKFTGHGTKMDYIVWPVLLRNEGGDVMSKGVAQPIAAKDK